MRELAAQGTPVEIIEGDGDNTTMARIQQDLNLNLKKKFDYCVRATAAFVNEGRDYISKVFS